MEYVVSGPRDGEAVLMIHGAIVAAAFQPIQLTPAVADYRTIRPHRRGHMGSSPVDTTNRPAPGAPSDFVLLMDALGVERAHVVGHSAGALEAVMLALQATDRVASLVLIDPAIPQALLPPPPASAGPDPVVAGMLRAQSLMAEGDREGALEAFLRPVQGDNWRAMFDAIPGSYEQALDDIGADDAASNGGLPPMLLLGPDDLAAISRPVLVIRAEDSLVVSEEAAAAFVAAFPDAESALIEAAGHGLITEKPEEVAEAIVEFLSRHPL
jgi:pimeloyl-ACP methyl ester carboxylesterase